MSAAPTVAAILGEHGIMVPSTVAGRYYTTCPKCSANRKTKDHRQARVLGITIDEKGVTWGCNHCQFKGGGCFNKTNGHGGEFVAKYDYVDEAGALLFQVCRNADHTFPQRRPNSLGGWAWKTAGVRRVLYRLPELIEDLALGRTIVLAEGEKDVDSLRAIGIPATCSPGGASQPGKKPKWRLEYSETLRGADTVLIPDHDEPGYAHAEATARMSLGIVKRVRYLDLAKHWQNMPEGADISDWLQAGYTREELDALIESAPDYRGEALYDDAVHAHKAAKRNRANVFNAEELNAMRFDPIKYVVPGYIVEGLTLMAGKPKIGKSWLLLNAAIAVARGGFTLGDVHCPPGDVLYAALEDNQRRLQSRMRKLLVIQPWPPRLSFTCEMPRLAEGGLDFIKTWIEAVERPRLIIIDTLAMVRAPKGKDQTPYDADYAAVVGLRDLAHKYGVAVVLVHHLRKAEADDAFDTISGTLGLTGAPDTVIVIKRDTSGAMLHARGRDLVEIEKALTFNAETCTWTVLGDADKVRCSNERGAIISAMDEANEPLGPNQIAEAAGMKAVNVRRLLIRMKIDGLVRKAAYGKYSLNRSHCHTSGHTPT